mmetsp:Transcript_10185/g.22022  ORF Transcript_10185/g.22022 Transcript_10185/m.22022 type:complete len:270 (-) Transcript_10185:621-1430(-)
MLTAMITAANASAAKSAVVLVVMRRILLWTYLSAGTRSGPAPWAGGRSTYASRADRLCIVILITTIVAILSRRILSSEVVTSPPLGVLVLVLAMAMATAAPAPRLMGAWAVVAAAVAAVMSVPLTSTTVTMSTAKTMTMTMTLTTSTMMTTAVAAAAARALQAVTTIPAALDIELAIVSVRTRRIMDVIGLPIPADQARTRTRTSTNIRTSALVICGGSSSRSKRKCSNQRGSRQGILLDMQRRRLDRAAPSRHLHCIIGRHDRIYAPR